MINKYTNKQRGLLAVIMAMVMVFAGAAFVAAEVDATIDYDNEGKLTTDVELSGPESLDGTSTAITINGNGKTISIGSGDKLNVSGTVTFNGVIFATYNSTVSDDVDNNHAGQIMIAAGSTVEFNNCTFTGDGEFAMNAKGDVTFDGNTDLNGKKVVITPNVNSLTVGENVEGMYLNMGYTGSMNVYNDVTDLTPALPYFVIPQDVTIDQITMRQGQTLALQTNVVLNVDKLSGYYRSGGVAPIITGGTLNSVTVLPYELNNTDHPTSGNSQDRWESINISDVSFSGTNKIAKDIEVTSSNGITVAKDGKLIIPEEVTIVASITNNGTIDVAGVITGDVINNGDISFLIEDAKINGTIGGTGVIDTSAIAEDVYIQGALTGPTEFGATQNVYVTDDLVVKSEQTLKVMGSLFINEGAVITVQEGGCIVLDGQAAKLINDGDIIIEATNGGLYDDATDPATEIRAPGALILDNGAKVENNGTIALDYYAEDNHEGWVLNVADGELVNNGTITVGEDSEFVVQSAGKFMNNGMFELYGEIVVPTDDNNEIGNIVNNGTMDLCGRTITAFTIDVLSADAIVNVDGMKALGDSVSIEITTDDIQDTDKVTYVDDSHVIIGLGIGESINGLKVTVVQEKDTVRSTSSVTFYNVKLVVAGDVTGASDEDVVFGTVAGDESYVVKITIQGDVVINDTLTLSAVDIIVDDEDADVTIDGTVSVVYDSNTLKVGKFYLNAGTVTINGLLTTTGADLVDNESGDKDIINAVYYSSKAGITPVVYYYTNLTDAVASGSQTITVLGVVDVTEDVNIPSGMTLDNSDAGLYIIDDVTLTLDVGAKYRNVSTAAIDKNETTGIVTGKGIYVDGTFVISDVKKQKDSEGIVADVKTVGENIITYTNLVNALNLAQDGDVIKLNKDAEISKDVTIKTGVTLDTNESDLSIKDKKTLTIDGKLYLNDGILDYTATGDEKAKVTLNGYIISNDEIPFNTYSIAGVYFQYFDKTDYYGITSIANITSAIEQDDDSEVDLYGELSVGNIAISGTTDESAVVNVNDKLTAGTITLDLASIEFDDAFVGTVSNGAGSITFDGTADDLIVTSSTKDDVKTLTVTGGFTAAEKKVITTTGEVSFLGFVATPVVVDGNVKVIATSTIEETEIEDLTVNGSVLVDNEATLTVGVAQVLGTLTVADETDDNDAAGTFDVEDLFLGIVYKDVDEGYSAPSLAATATLVGGADISNLMYVIAGSSFPEDLVDENTSAVELYVEGELWMTIYSFGTETSVTVDQIPVENVKFEGWATKEGGEGSDNTTVEFSKEKYYADIKYNVYEVKFVIAEGIDDVYLDGILVQGSSILGSYENQFVSAGTHTISYTLANGYTGEAKMLVDGKEVSGYTFTTEGEYDGVIYIITLQGIEKAPAETGSVVEEEGMDLTDILLIVLVVLIVIMAIIVALRMMRS